MFLSFNILFAYAVDYDLFLFCRVWEYWMDGYDNKSAVLMALVETGPIITCVGVNMAISFFFFMIDEIPQVTSMGFIFFCGILLDTFIIRTCIAPAFLMNLEGLNYWPGVMPEPTKKYDHAHVCG